MKAVSPLRRRSEREHVGKLAGIGAMPGLDGTGHGAPSAVVTFVVRSQATLRTFLSAAEVRMSPLLTVEEAATELGTPVRFVRRLIQERRIRFHKIGKYVRIARADLERFVEASKVEPSSAGR